MHRGKKIIVIILLCKFHEILYELVVSGVKGRGPKRGCDH